MVDSPPSIGTLRDCSKYSTNAASVYWRISISFISSVVGVHQPTKVPDPLSGTSRALQVFNLADCRFFSEYSSGSPEVSLEYHSATSAKIARLANSFAFARPIHSSGHRSKKLNMLNTSDERSSIGSFGGGFGLMHFAILFGEIDSSPAVCSLIYPKIASIQVISAVGYEEKP